jgi:hypothetical protein
MTFSATDFDTLSGRDPAGQDTSWLVREVEQLRAPDSSLLAVTVKTHDGTPLLRKSLPSTNPIDRSRAEMLLDNEIRALTRLHARYPRALPELPALVGYDFDSADPFVLLEPYRGRSVDGGLHTLLIDERRRFMIGLFRALAQLAAVDLVHGSVGPASLCWDGETTQLVNLEHAVSTGEPSRSSLSRNGSLAHPGHDVRAAGRVVHELFTGKRVGLGDVPDLTKGPEVLATLLRDVFAPDPERRPTAVEVLERLNDREPLPAPSDVDGVMSAGYARFDAVRPAAGAPQVTRMRPPSPPARPARRRAPLPLVPLGVLVLLVTAAAVVLLVVV